MVDLDLEIQRTSPDFVVYKPKSNDGSHDDTGNEHFLVLDAPDNSLMAFWTQSSHELKGDHRIVFSKSFDKGQTWSDPQKIAGYDEKTGERRTSWQIPLISNSGRIYVLYNRQIDKIDMNDKICGIMAGKYSDDFGKTWSAEENIPLPESIWDSAEKGVPGHWVVWQVAKRNKSGKYFVGQTRWVSESRRKNANSPLSVTEFLTFNNIDDNPDVKDIDISFHAQNEDALFMPGHSVEEPAWVNLPDGRIMTVMRTTFKMPFFSISEDEGKTWSRLMPLRQKNHGPVLIHQLSPCPIYEIGEGKYIFFFHNNTELYRRPAYYCYGKYVDDPIQPIEFEEPVYWGDNDGIPLGPGGRKDFALYTSMTFIDGRPVLWYPERKFFLLGKFFGK